MKTETEWKAQDFSCPENSGCLGILAFQDNSGEWHDFTVMGNDTHLAFGDACNAGFLESGNIERESHETTDETLAEMLADLETYYNDGPDYVARIVFNERL